MARTTRTKRKWPGSPFWDRLVRITGEDDPGRLVYLTGLGYSQLIISRHLQDAEG